MSSQVLTAAVPATVADTGSPRRAMFALARVESVRLLRHPVSIGGVLLFLGPWVFGWITGSVSQYPVLSADVAIVQLLGMMTVGIAAMIAANLVSLRPHRHRTESLYEVLVLPARWRTGGLLFALVPFVSLVAIVSVARAAILALLPASAGRFDLAEVLTTPVVALLLGAVGVLLARVVRSTVVGLLAALVVAVVAFVGMTLSISDVAVRWLLPVAMLSDVVPSDFSDRPATWHLLYLVGLVALVVVAALARTESGHSGVRGSKLAVGAGLAAIVFVAGGVPQLLPDDAALRARTVAMDDPAPSQTCRRVGDVTYCAYRDFTGWIDGWDNVLRGVRRAVPDNLAVGPGLAVRQRFDVPDRKLVGLDGSSMTTSGQELERLQVWRRADAAAGTPEAVPIGVSWGDESSEATLAGAVAYRLITGKGSPDNGLVCGARGALLVWLVGQATPETASGLRKRDRSSWGALALGDGSLSELAVPDYDAASGLALLKKPLPEATALVRQHWQELTAPAADAARFATLVGVPATPLPPVEERSICGG